jgi:hypothetical protein
LDGSPAEISIDSDPETGLLLANLDSALRNLAKTEAGENSPGSLSRLEQALQTYGSIKHLLPKLNLTARQRAPVETQLQALRAQILAHSTYRAN